MPSNGQSHHAAMASVFQFPLVVVDFEATALTLESYPIEVGVARAVNSADPVSSWSALIVPDPTWNVSAQWDPDAERVHGISRWELRSGTSARDVMTALNAWAGDVDIVWCDGGRYDASWLRTLAEAACVEPNFALGDLSAVLAANYNRCDSYLEFISRSAAPHRAGPDAERICRALMLLAPG